MPTLTLVQAEGLVVRTLTRSRTSIDNARSVARALVAAEADGLKGHGLSRTPMYAAQAKVRRGPGICCIVYLRDAGIATERNPEGATMSWTVEWSQTHEADLQEKDGTPNVYLARAGKEEALEAAGRCLAAGNIVWQSSMSMAIWKWNVTPFSTCSIHWLPNRLSFWTSIMD